MAQPQGTPLTATRRRVMKDKMYDKFMIRLWLEGYEKMGDTFNLIMSNPQDHLYYGEKHPVDGYRNFVVVKRDASTGILCVTVNSRDLDGVDPLILGIVERATVDIETSQEGQKIDGVSGGIYKIGDCFAQRSTAGPNRCFYAEGKDPIVLRDFVQDIMDIKILRVNDGEDESLTADDLLAKLDAAETTIEQIKYALEHAEAEKAEAVTVVQEELKTLKFYSDVDKVTIRKIDDIANWLGRRWKFPFITKSRVYNMIRKHIWTPSFED